jgi:hypothetical protein
LFLRRPAAFGSVENRTAESSTPRFGVSVPFDPQLVEMLADDAGRGRPQELLRA